MRRTFSLQMYDLPPGRAFTCPGCGAASMRDPNAPAPVCAGCSPFMSVTNNGRDTIEATCRWATKPILLSSYVGAVQWAAGENIPDHVLDSLRQHFMKNPIPIRIVPAPVGLPTSQDGVINVVAGSALKKGDMVIAADGSPVGKAQASAAAGELVEVVLSTAGLPEPDPASSDPTRINFPEFLKKLADDVRGS